MADLSKLKKRNSLGAPPSPEEASQNLSAPEVAPAIEAVAPEQGAEAESVVQLRPSTVPPPMAAEKIEKKTPAPKSAKKRIDGRSLRKTGRTEALSTRVTEAFGDKLRMIAQRDKLLIAEVLEKGVEAYEASRKK